MTIEEMIAAKEAKKAELATRSKASTDIAEVRSINEQIDALNADILNLRSAVPAPAAPAAAPVAPEALTPEQRAAMIEKTNAEQRAAAEALSKGNHIPNPMAQVVDEKRGIDAVLAMPCATPEQSAEMRNALFGMPEYRTGYFKMLAGRSDLNDVEKRALTTAANSGGAAVPTTTYDLIIKRMTQTSALFGLIRKTYLPGNVVLPVANAQTAAQWSSEAPGTDQDDTLSQVALGAYALSKFAKVKGQLILMAIDALETYIVEAISDQIAIAVENAILNGTGSSQPTGILTGVTFDATNSATWAKGSTVGYDDLVGAKALLGLYRSNAVWVMNAAMEAQIYKVKTTTNQPLFTQNPITGLIANPLGFPMVVDYYMPDNTILLMNPDYYYMNINQNPQILTDNSAGFTSTATYFRGTMYLDAKPALNAAFVKLTQATV